MENERILTNEEWQMFFKEPQRIAAFNAVKFAYTDVGKAIKDYEMDCNLSCPVTVINRDFKALVEKATELYAAVIAMKYVLLFFRRKVKCKNDDG